MTDALTFATPQQAYREMVAAGAVFSIRQRDDMLGVSFTYRVAVDGNPIRCREILAAVKARPSVFMGAFRAAVQADAASSKRGAA